MYCGMTSANPEVLENMPDMDLVLMNAAYR